MNLQPLNNYLIVKLLEPKEDIVASGILLTQKSLDKPRWAVVQAVGEGQPNMSGTRHKPLFDVDDIVFLFRHAPVAVTTKDEPGGETFALSEGDIWCKIQMIARIDGTGSDIQILPMGNLMHVEPIVEDRQKVSPGGIILPDKAQEKPTRAKVLAVGPGQRAENGNFLTPLVTPGDIVRYMPYQRLEINFNDLGDPRGKQFLLAYGDTLARPSPASQVLPHEPRCGGSHGRCQNVARATGRCRPLPPPARNLGDSRFTQRETTLLRRRVASPDFFTRVSLTGRSPLSKTQAGKRILPSCPSRPAPLRCPCNGGGPSFPGVFPHARGRTQLHERLRQRSHRPVDAEQPDRLRAGSSEEHGSGETPLRSGDRV